MKGITFIELLFAMALTILICSSVATIYLASVKNHLTTASLQNIQQNARVAFQLLNSALRLAGYIGCAKLTDNFPIFYSESYKITSENKIQSYEGNELKTGTNAFTIRYSSSLNNTLITTMNKLDTLQISNYLKVSIGDVLLISDCKTADIFVVLNISIQKDGTQLLTADRNLSKRYEKNAEISLFNIDTFYIGKTDRKDKNGFPIWALYKKDQFAHKTELVEGITDMQIRYTNGNSIENGDSVIGVSVQLNFVSLNDIPLQKINYDYIALRE